METIISLLLSLVLLPPIPAAKVAAKIYKVPEKALVKVVKRESRGERIGIHEVDEWLSKRSCKKAVNVGWLPNYVDCNERGWGTRGVSGLISAYHVRYVWIHLPKWVLDIPIVSTLISAKKWRRWCRKRRKLRWCPNYG